MKHLDAPTLDVLGLEIDSLPRLPRQQMELFQYFSQVFPHTHARIHNLGTCFTHILLNGHS